MWKVTAGTLLGQLAKTQPPRPSQLAQKRTCQYLSNPSLTTERAAKNSIWTFAGTQYKMEHQLLCESDAEHFGRTNSWKSANLGSSPQEAKGFEPKFITRRFCDEEGDVYITNDGKSLKKSPSAWSLHDYVCQTSMLRRSSRRSVISSTFYFMTS